MDHRAYRELSYLLKPTKERLRTSVGTGLHSGLRYTFGYIIQDFFKISKYTLPTSLNYDEYVVLETFRLQSC